MKKKATIVLIVLVVVVGVIVAFNLYTSHRNENEILNEVSAVIDENLKKVYSSHDAEEYEISNIQYEITNIEKAKHTYTADYRFRVVFSCDARNDLDYIEKSLVAYAIENTLDIFGDSRFKTSSGLRVTDRNESSYEQVDTYVNEELVHKNGVDFSSSGNKSDAKPSDKNLQDAWNCATDVVKNELYHYSNIKVSSYGNSTVTYTSSTGIYTIKGTVSYKNQFNATVNSKFTVQLKLTEHGYSDSSILIY